MKNFLFSIKQNLAKIIHPNKNNELELFNVRSFIFWKSIITAFILCSLFGRWLEIPYCWLMSFFGIVDESYAAMSDPWWHPFWIYGVGAVIFTFVIEPIKEYIINHSKNNIIAIGITLLICIVMAGVIELSMRLLVNQPDAITGEYPYWNNSQLPGNILQQAWIVNDIVIGIVGTIYVWLIFPLISWCYSKITSIYSAKISNIVFGILCGCFIVATTLSYLTIVYFL